MRTLLKCLILSLFVVTSNFVNAQVSINQDNSLPDASAMLDVQSTSKGMLVPRMTSNQRIAIATPATGLLVFDTVTTSFWYYDGTNWLSLSDTDATNEYNTSVVLNGTTLETTDAGGTISTELSGLQDVDWLKTDGTQATAIGNNIYTNGNVGVGTSSPSFPIDVQGTGGERLRAYTTDTYYAGYLSKNSTREFFAGVQATFETNDASSGYHIYDNTIGQQRFVIDKDGDVGIGQTNPNAKLHVNGDVRFVDGTQGDGKVLTSDASGFGSWQTPTDNVDDADADPTNEYNTGFSLTAKTLSLTDAGGTLDVDISSLADEDWTFNSGTGDAGQIFHSGQVAVGGTTTSLDGAEYRLYAERNSTDGAAIMGYNGTSRGLLGVWDGSIPNLDLPSVQSVGVLGYCPDFSNNSRAVIYGYAENTAGTAFAGMFRGGQYSNKLWGVCQRCE